MNKKIIPLMLLSSFLLTGCEFINSFFPEEDFVPADKEDEPVEVEFAITSAAFTKTGLKASETAAPSATASKR